MLAIRHHAKIMTIDRFIYRWIWPSFYQDTEPLAPRCLFTEINRFIDSLHAVSAGAHLREPFLIYTSLFPSPPIRIANKALSSHGACHRSPKQCTIHSLVLQTSVKQRALQRRAACSNPHPPSFEVNILRKVLSYSPSYHCITNPMDIDDRERP